MEKLVDEGKCKNIGLSNFNIEQVIGIELDNTQQPAGRYRMVQTVYCTASVDRKQMVQGPVVLGHYITLYWDRL